VKTRKRVEISVETERILFVSRRRLTAITWCKGCGRRSEMITVDEAACSSRVSSRTIYRWVEAGKVHFIETGDGRLLVCHDSLPPAGVSAP
jgi:excisionase family DNA binding protein